MMSWQQKFFRASNYFVSFLIFALPLRVRYFLGDLVGILWFDIFRIRRQVIIDNIEIVFPGLPEAQKIQIGRTSVCNLGRSFIEFLTLQQIDENWLRENVVITGLEKVREIEKRQQGILLLSLHVGNGDMACTILSLAGVKIHLISKKFNVRWLNEFWFGVRSKFGTQFIEAHGKRTSFDILKALSKGEHVIFVLDQYMGRPEGIPTTFFGRKTGTAYGLALFHMKTQSPVLPIYTLRGEDLKTYIHFGDEITYEEQADRDQTIHYMTEKYNRCLEKIILQHPKQWMWVHRRWKKIRE